MTAPAAMAITFFAAPPTWAPTGSSLPYSRKCGVASRAVIVSRRAASAAASTAAAGRPAAISCAKFGPVSTAAGTLARNSVTTSSGRRNVPASTPLAQTTSGAAEAGIRSSTLAQMLHRHRQQHGVGGSAAARRRSAPHPARGGRAAAGSRGSCRSPRRAAGSRAHRRTLRPGTRRLDGQRGAPGAGADHRDATHRPAASPSRPRRLRGRRGGPAAPPGSAALLLEAVGRIDHQQAATVQPRRIERLAQAELGGDDVADAALAGVRSRNGAHRRAVLDRIPGGEHAGAETAHGRRARPSASRRTRPGPRRADRSAQGRADAAAAAARPAPPRHRDDARRPAGHARSRRASAASSG